MRITAFRVPTAAAVFIAGLALATVALAGGDWNETGIAWKTYDEALAEAKSANKPVCLVIYTEWCPHCTNYSKVFHDPSIVELTKKFAMVHIDKDKDPATSGKFAPDGEYIPRTLFLKADGTLLPITEKRDQYKYFYDEKDPKAVMRAMNEALAGSPPK